MTIAWIQFWTVYWGRSICSHAKVLIRFWVRRQNGVWHFHAAITLQMSEDRFRNRKFPVKSFYKVVLPAFGNSNDKKFKLWITDCHRPFVHGSNQILCDSLTHFAVTRGNGAIHFTFLSMNIRCWNISCGQKTNHWMCLTIGGLIICLIHFKLKV